MKKRNIKMFISACVGSLGFTGMFIFTVGIVDAPLVCIPLAILCTIMFFVGAIKHNQYKRFYLNDKPVYLKDTMPRLYQGKAL